MLRSTVELRELAALRGLRSMQAADVEALIELAEACRVIDKIESVPTAAQIRFQFETPGIDIVNNAFLLEDDKGVPIATLTAVPLPGADEYHFQLQMTVHPDHRSGEDGIEDLLLEFGLAHSTEWQRASGNRASIQTGCRSDQQHYIDLYSRHSFEPIRYFHTLERDLRQPIEAAPVPDNVVIRSIDFGRDSSSLHQALHDSFQDHFNPMNFTAEQTMHWASSPEFRADLILIAFGTEDGRETEPAGVCMNLVRNNYNAQHNKLEGEVGALGVRRPFRRKGLARALLTKGLQLLREEGMTMAVLSVDSENPLGATQLYASVGFSQRKTSIVFEFRGD